MSWPEVRKNAIRWPPNYQALLLDNVRVDNFADSGEPCEIRFATSQTLPHFIRAYGALFSVVDCAGSREETRTARESYTESGPQMTAGGALTTSSAGDVTGNVQASKVHVAG